MEKVIPAGLNYADLKPELIENRVKLIQFRPHSSATGAQPGQTIRFDIKSNGFFDPYSAYFKFQVTVKKPPKTDTFNFAQCIDRSAHSIFRRFILRSNNKVLERIEDYDIMAAMVNDILYSNEQKVLKHYEGFPHLAIVPDQVRQILSPDAALALNADGNTAGAQVKTEINTAMVLPNDRVLGYQGTGDVVYDCGDVGYYRVGATRGTITTAQRANMHVNAAAGAADLTIGSRIQPEVQNNGVVLLPIAAYGATSVEETWSGYIGTTNGETTGNHFVVRPVDQYSPVGKTFTGGEAGPYASISNIAAQYGLKDLSVDAANSRFVQEYPSTDEDSVTLEFCIPLYSGLIGVMMQDKKLIPLSLIPLEIELELNPYFMYCAGGMAPQMYTGPANETTMPQSYRNYVLKDITLYSHVLEFEQEVHRSLEAIVVQHGIFIHYPTFYQGPVTGSLGNNLTVTHNINIHAKSINSIHGVWLDKRYEYNAHRRRLDFVAPRMDSVQIRNGTEYIPSLPIESKTPSSKGEHSQLLIETYKAWNKMHNPALDSALTSPSYQKTMATSYRNFRNLQELYIRQGNLGRFQWGISFEGEEIGKDKDTISGKRGLIPFDAMVKGKFEEIGVAFESHIFARVDYFLYVRPDLVITVLGE